MIPVVSTNKTGDLSYQVFNDVLTDIEKINRDVLATLLYAQQHLTDENTQISKLNNEGFYTAEKLATLHTAAETLHSSVVTAIETFETAITA